MCGVSSLTIFLIGELVFLILHAMVTFDLEPPLAAHTPPFWSSTILYYQRHATSILNSICRRDECIATTSIHGDWGPQ